MFSVGMSPVRVSVCAFVCLLAWSGFQTQASPQSERLTRAGLEKLKNQDVKSAAKLFNSAVKADRNDGKAIFYLGVALNRLNLHDLAFRQFQSSIRLKQFHRDLGFEAGWAAQATGRNRSAIAFLEPYVKKNSRNAKAHEFLGRAYAATKQWGKADASLREAMRLNPALKPTVLLALSQIASQRGDVATANNLANRILREAPTSRIGGALSTRQALDLSQQPRRRGPKKPWSAYVATTIGHNDNVIGFSGEFALPPEITSKSAGFVTVEGGGKYAWTLGSDQTVTAGYDVRIDTFFGLAEQDVWDNNFYALYERALRQLSGNVVASVRASYGRTQVNGDRFQDAFTVRPAVSFQPHENVGMEFFFARTMSDVNESDGIAANDSRDADQNVFGGRMAVTIPEANMAVTVGLARLHNNADGSDNGYRATQFSLGARVMLFDDYTVNAQYTKTDYNYTAPHSLAPFIATGLGFAFAREDDVAAFDLRVSRPINDMVSGFAKFQFTDTTSNLRLFTYSQQVIGAGLLARF